jgi:Tfp pilus assembly protein PilN
MIKVNLSGTGKKKASRAGFKLAMPASAMPFVLAAIVLGSAGGGFWWWTSLDKQIADLDMKIKQSEAQIAALDSVIKQDQVFEARKKALETRVKVIESLQKNQVSPVIALDQLAEAIEKTKYVWLQTLDQNNAILSMNATGTSFDAIASLVSNLSATGYFKNVELGTLQESGGNYTFSLKCEFSPPPRAPVPNAQPATAGGN